MRNLKVSCAFVGIRLYNPLRISLEKEFVEACEQRENRFLLVVLPGAFARWVKRWVKAHFAKQVEGKPHLCSHKC
jgi:hypothetical protein